MLPWEYYLNFVKLRNKVYKFRKIGITEIYNIKNIICNLYNTQFIIQSKQQIHLHTQCFMGQLSWTNLQ